MSIQVNGLVFDGPAEARRYKEGIKASLYQWGWVFDRGRWCLLETRKPGKRLHIELRNWVEAYDWEMKMRGGDSQKGGEP